jgi:REP element-mobilizing transposase RayT
MTKTLGYMITWTTYGTWLQGDKRGYVKNGTIHQANPKLAMLNLQNLIKNPVILTNAHRIIVQKAIYEKAHHLNQKIRALAVCSNHVHFVVNYIPRPVGIIVRLYKIAAQVALRKVGISGRVWTLGFDKRHCFDQQTLKKRIDYVNSHTNSKYK